MLLPALEMVNVLAQIVANVIQDTLETIVNKWLVTALQQLLQAFVA